jgi:AcrR family transcriptional regulator
VPSIKAMEPKDKKKHILDTAEELFASKGFEAATVRDIADAAGVNLAMISYYFGSKEKMMESLFTERMEIMKMKVESLIKDDTLTPFQKIESAIAEYVKKVTAKQAFHKIMVCEQIMKKNPVVVRLVREMKVNYMLLFTELVKEGQRKKVFKKKIDIILAISTMTGTVSHMIINREYYSDFYQQGNLSEEETTALIYNNTTNHLKSIFKTILGYEE